MSNRLLSRPDILSIIQTLAFWFAGLILGADARTNRGFYRIAKSFVGCHCIIHSGENVAHSATYQAPTITSHFLSHDLIYITRCILVHRSRLILNGQERGTRALAWGRLGAAGLEGGGPLSWPLARMSHEPSPSR